MFMCLRGFGLETPVVKVTSHQSEKGRQPQEDALHVLATAAAAEEAALDVAYDLTSIAEL